MKWTGIFIDKREKKRYPTAPYTRLKWTYNEANGMVVISEEDSKDIKEVIHHSVFHRLVLDKVFVYK